MPLVVLLDEDRRNGDSAERWRRWWNVEDDVGTSPSSVYCFAVRDSFSRFKDRKTISERSSPVREVFLGSFLVFLFFYFFVFIFFIFFYFFTFFLSWEKMREIIGDKDENVSLCQYIYSPFFHHPLVILRTSNIQSYNWHGSHRRLFTIIIIFLVFFFVLFSFLVSIKATCSNSRTRHPYFFFLSDDDPPFPLRIVPNVVIEF